jgi:hypothetical protein
MSVSFRKLTMLGSLLLAMCGFSSYAIAQVQFSDDFEPPTYTLYVGPGSQGLLSDPPSWKIFAAVFLDYPGCSQYV